ncbi:DUF177 domain-containing protein [Peptococcaceae bacterium 1198_IL3148]
MRINVAFLKKALGDSKHFELAENLPSIDIDGNEVVFKGPAKVSIDVTNADTHLEVKGTINTVAQLTCGRCLEKYNFPVDTELIESYHSAETGEGNADDESKPFTGDYIDIEQDVVEAIQLSLPMRQICSEDCKGLCPHCGINRNLEQCDCKEDDVDPRLAVLKDLFNKK